MRTFYVCAVLIAVGTSAGFWLGVYAQPPDDEVPCEVIPVKAIPDDPCKLKVCAGGNRKA